MSQPAQTEHRQPEADLLEAAVEEILEDAQEAPEAFAEDAIVPEGGE